MVNYRTEYLLKTQISYLMHENFKATEIDCSSR